MQLETIPKKEHANMISVYWQLMRSMESQAQESNCPLDKLTVEGSYRLWNRVTGDDKKPVWLDKSDTKR